MRADLGKGGGGCFSSLKLFLPESSGVGDVWPSEPFKDGLRPLRNPRSAFLDAAQRTFWNKFCDDPVTFLFHDLSAARQMHRQSIAGRVGTGFSEKLLKALSLELNKIAVKSCPFFNLPTTGRGLDPGLSVAEMKRCIWVKPLMVCEVKFTEWTRDDRLRQPVFLGLREDKSVSEVIREKAS